MPTGNYYGPPVELKVKGTKQIFLVFHQKGHKDYSMRFLTFDDALAYKTKYTGLYVNYVLKVIDDPRCRNRRTMGNFDRRTK